VAPGGSLDDALVAEGKYVRLETRGRQSGLPRVVTVGFVPAGDGTILVVARHGAAWAENLLDDPRCRVTVGDRTWDADAEPLEGADFGFAIR
jgi:deazaflavin-dependent oxidoreductase (nitroreductase family)